MANFKLTQTGEQIQADLDLLDKNSATQGQVLTADGSGGASWQNSGGSGGLYFHQITLSFTPNDPSENPENQAIMAIFGLYLNSLLPTPPSSMPITILGSLCIKSNSFTSLCLCINFIKLYIPEFFNNL